MKYKVLVTGGAGNIGTNLCKELESRGHQVTSCDLYNTERDNYVRCDVRNYRQIEYVFDNEDTVQLACYDYSEEHGSQDHLSVALATKEIYDFYVNEAYK